VNDRIRGYRAALEENGLQADESRIHYLSSKTLIHENGNSDTAKEIISSVKNKKTEAFICVNDSTAADLMMFFLRNGIRIPEDIRIVGFDDLPLNNLLPIPLTTVRQPLADMAYESVRTMVDRIENPDTTARDIMVKTELIVRESCGCKL
jgi:DNA-binding LacI/PurR family transcriptional regulator